MENLMEIVAASFARHRIECPGDSTFASGPLRADNTVPQVRERSVRADLGLSGELPPASLTPLPDHNFQKRLQGDPAP